MLVAFKLLTALLTICVLLGKGAGSCWGAGSHILCNMAPRPRYEWRPAIDLSNYLWKALGVRLRKNDAVDQQIYQEEEKALRVILQLENEG